MTNKFTTVVLLATLMFISGCKNNESDCPLKSFKLSDVKINEGPFYTAQQADLNYILELDVDRLLAPYLKDAGLSPIKDNYTNWENTGLDGHIGGHYLSALSFMYAATGNQKVLERINYMLTWLDRCQVKNGNGYVGGVPNGQKIWKEIEKGQIHAGSFSLNGRWVPLYNIHKTFAGLYDVYTVVGIEEAKQILVKLTNWFYETTKNLSDEQVQDMLRSEHGGLNDVFVDVANITGDEKYLQMAKRFSHMAILNPLLEQRNELMGMHANTQIPKVIGYEKYAIATNNVEWEKASAFFWETIINNWTISIGGNSVREHFHPANDFKSMIESEQGPESCNTYNMLKLTRLLYLSHPDKKYIDYYERALFNHILSSEHPSKGGFVYFTPMRPRHYRVYSQPHTSFWCCVGSGLENPGKYGEMIYAHGENSVYVNLFIPSELNWSDKGIELIQETKFPTEESTRIKVKVKQPVKFDLKIRIPGWVNSNYEILINDKATNVTVDANGYGSINRKWNNDDYVDFKFKMHITAEYLPDSSNWVSFKYGPIVLGAITDTTNLKGLFADDSRMGHVANGFQYPLNEAPAIVASSVNNLERLLSPIESQPMHFSISNLEYAENKNLILQPFYQIHEARYIVYWPVYKKDEYKQMQEEIAIKEKELQALNKITIDLVWPGEQQPESDHFVKFKDSESGVYKNKHWRHASGFFSYQFKNPGTVPCKLRVTYNGADSGRRFKILINGVVIAEVESDGSYGDTFVDVDYDVPQSAIGKSAGKPIEIKFEAEEGSVAGGVFGIRLLRKA